MAVLVQAWSIVVANAALEQRFPGGTQMYARSCPTSLHCSDGKLSAVSFMTEEHAARFTGFLTTYGFTDPFRGTSSEVAVVIEDEGLLTPCDWLQVDCLPLRDESGEVTQVTVASLAGERPTTFARPQHWRASRRPRKLTIEEMERDYEFVREDPVGEGSGRLLTYQHRATKELIYVPRLDVGPQPGEARLATFRQELSETLAMPISRRRDERLAALYEDCSSMVESTGRSDPSWLQLQGHIAMRSSRWNVAEQALRRLTEIRPNYLQAWLDLTFVLAAKLDRLVEAEAAARHAVAIDSTDAAAHGNLANVLSIQGKTDAAIQAVRRALELNPSDPTNRAIHDRLVSTTGQDNSDEATAATDSADSEAETGTPWYKRLFRTSRRDPEC